ncbi:hypothetical protein PHYBLDRAFT_143907 [Phycomyces blakesleeanus NRRL 1555(-)]|uniref:Uncharacterized protein n=1 Tax=Phycomyces blakesleeanus (strain ATCC 8743b / DSM 1359 / FGSC 10004 / NBRC 33097 / NRRL 1555) TaxID=763407 RepID=A0A163ATE2_PHYB8|nr:hypothetical protein PHYBLDRAFT_143907 [Phycomyces blakesleeanus NRRL 1555(-)]OAD75661.1 hypothetical protein PHYBLDRAFT_143907 [Phycomyces blakesleeanus NRRL 1555(-)]|eukprot:XP_018293701.1 hypothetical protein PHYBLDRAFT_143907 [Phycomyces blakesleeanus NRRL 1555(-)]
MHKTQAFSLSGSPLPDWNTFLCAYDVTDWHDRTSPTSLQYLGFPLFSSITQQDSYGTTLLSKIETFCSIHGSRSLSFFCSIVRGFFHVNSFPPIAFDTLCLPRLQGGLGILDPGIQQCALQLCWLKPLIRNPLLPHGLVPQWFSTLLCSDVPTVDPLLPLLFSDCHPRNHRTLDSPLHLVLKAMDTLP